VVRSPISRAIRSFGLPRGVLLDLLMHIHEGMVRDFESSRHRRMSEDPRCYRYRIAIPDNDGEHLFVVAVDDTTSPDHLLVVNIGHGML
jgi:hypothetical protein